MKLIIGLGNPGIEYLLTRHNIGFIITNYFSRSQNIEIKEGSGEWLVGFGSYENIDLAIIKPITFMNNSGIAVKDFIEKYEVPLTDMLVIYDDFNIPFGSIRVRIKGSDGGHNGISSIIYHLNSNEFTRMRIGIGPEDGMIHKSDAIDYVLNNFNAKEVEEIKKLMPEYINCIKSFLTEDIKLTMNRFNKSFLTN
jgi:PTH1 family peptidyl-tRNA hydrolase